MSLLRELLLNKKLFEANEEIDKFLEDNEIEPGSVVHRIEFSGETYSDNEQVNDFLDAHYLSGYKIDAVGEGFSVVLFDEIAFINSTIQSVNLRDGVDIVIGMLRPMTSDNPLMFSDKSNGTIKLSSDHPYIIEIATVVDGFHAQSGEVKITKDTLLSFKANFDNNVYGADLSIDFDHETREAAGWIKELYLSEDGDTLLAGIKWTPKGALSLSNREFRYFSPEYHPNWIHPHTGASHGPTLLGGGLVNRPFLKMGAIVTMNERKQGATIVETIKMSDHNAKVTELENVISTLKLSESTAKNTITGMKADNVKMSEEIQTMKADAEKKKKEDEINLLFSEQKINKAQKDAMIEGKSMVEVLQLSENLNTTPAGSNAAANDGALKLSDDERELCKNMGLTEEDFIKYNKEGGL